MTSSMQRDPQWSRLPSRETVRLSHKRLPQSFCFPNLVGVFCRACAGPAKPGYTLKAESLTICPLCMLLGVVSRVLTREASHQWKQNVDRRACILI